MENNSIILSVSDNRKFRVKTDYLVKYFNQNHSQYNIQHATLPSSTGWDIIDPVEGIPQKWVIWTCNLFNKSKPINTLGNDNKLIIEESPENEDDYFIPNDDDDGTVTRFRQTRIVFTKSDKNSYYIFRGVFIPDYESSSPYIHHFKRIATSIEIIKGAEPKIRILDLDFAFKAKQCSIEYDSAEEHKYIQQVENNFDAIDSPIEYIPTPETAKESIITGSHSVYPRDPKQALIALERANNECEIGPGHPSFIRRTNGKKYTEPHHIIPVSMYRLFLPNSVDVPANIVSLCSTCHNCIHYGRDIDRNLLLNEIFNKRKEELKQAGLSITLEELLQMY